MTVFELANEYRALESLVDSEHNELADDDLLRYWLAADGELNAKLENIGFAIKNREAVKAGKQEAIESLGKQCDALDTEINRLKQLAIRIMDATGKPKVPGKVLTLSVVAKPVSVVIEDGSAIPSDYLRIIPAVPESTAPDKKKIAEDMKLGVIVPGARLESGVRLAIK